MASLLSGAKIQKIQMIIVTLTCPQDEAASKELPGSLEIQFSLAKLEHGCYTLYWTTLMN